MTADADAVIIPGTKRSGAGRSLPLFFPLPAGLAGRLGQMLSSAPNYEQEH